MAEWEREIDIPLEADTPENRRFFQEMGRTIVREIRSEISRHSFDGSPVDLMSSFDWDLYRGKLVISSDHPAVEYLNFGVEEHVMEYLEGAGPIPIMKDNGDVIFRKATPQSMDDGSWVHPGLQGQHFLERAFEKAEEEMNREYADETAKKVADKIGEKLGSG